MVPVVLFRQDFANLFFLFWPQNSSQLSFGMHGFHKNQFNFTQKTQDSEKKSRMFLRGAKGEIIN
jgi:hypothetical protein